MFLAPSCSDLGESLLITTLLGISLRELDDKKPTAGAHRGASRQRSLEEPDGFSQRQSGARKRHLLPCRLLNLRRRWIRRLRKLLNRPRSSRSFKSYKTSRIQRIHRSTRRNRIFEPQQRSPNSIRIRRNQSQNTLRFGRGLGKTAGRFQARNCHGWKETITQSHPSR